MKTTVFTRFLLEFYTSPASRTCQKILENRSGSLSNRASHKDRAKNSFWGPSSLNLEGSGTLLGSSWPALGRSWPSFGRSWARLGRFLGVSWALLDASWLPNAAQEDPGLDFGRFWEHPGRVSEVPKLYFSRFFRTFRSNAFHNTVTTLLHFPTLLLLLFWCGGLCAAHGIRRTL